LAQNKFQEALVIDRETKQRLKEVIDGHRGSVVIKRPSVLFVKSEAPSTGETIRDSGIVMIFTFCVRLSNNLLITFPSASELTSKIDVEMKKSTSISSVIKAESQQPQQKAKSNK